MKIVIKNCPAYELMRTATSGTYFNICGNAKGHIKCCDIDDCVIKQIVEMCKNEKQKEETQRYKTNGYVLARSILNLLEIEVIKE